MIFHTVSVKQPWAWALLQPAPKGKDVENRTRPFPAKYVGHRLILHAGKQYDHSALPFLRARGLDVPSNLPTGGIVGSIMFSGSSQNNPSRWAEPGLHHWIVTPTSAEVIPFYPWPGQLGFFKIELPPLGEDSDLTPFGWVMGLHLRATGQARKFILEQNKSAGVMPCPACGGNLH